MVLGIETGRNKIGVCFVQFSSERNHCKVNTRANRKRDDKLVERIVEVEEKRIKKKKKRKKR